jgi:predicted nucleotidyltransferase
MDDELVVRLIREALPDLVAIYRFGSSATGGFRAESDVDLACLGRRPLDPVERFELQERLANALGRDVDLVDLLAASTVMRMQVVSRGLPIFDENPGERHRFETYVFSSYARLNEERRALLDQIRRDGVIHAR